MQLFSYESSMFSYESVPRSGPCAIHTYPARSQIVYWNELPEKVSRLRNLIEFFIHSHGPVVFNETHHEETSVNKTAGNRPTAEHQNLEKRAPTTLPRRALETEHKAFLDRA